MSEIRTKVKYIKVDMVCNYCGDGYMRPIGTVLKENPPKYVHECDNCGNKGIYEVRYPYKEDKHEKRLELQS